MVAALVPLRVCAEPLQRAGVSAFTLRADTTKPRAGSRFHLIVILRLRQSAAAVRNLRLPPLAGLDVLGDEQDTRRGARGMLYREIVTVVAKHSGSVTIAPATFDAIDPRDAKAKEYASDSLVLHVWETPSQQLTRVPALATRVLLSAGAGLLALGVALLAITVMRPAIPAPTARAPLVAQPSPRERLQTVLADLQTDPTRTGAMHARGILYRMLGVPNGGTLADAMQEAKRAQPRLLGALTAVERAAFTHEGDLRGAIEHAVDALRKALF